ncbi:kinase-like protein [Pseudovirgaria hyperparasitica]|uniref:Kinase-like protein n=1 Tax=Pseudovirgaria hyperparasitica TaxID=470096 RepID=A0A6A6W820_9PEZI|nr:kinase-like protein [Pseudovirgaria hyperparasitica]KAF2759038.1 kinase-like protein [Pseudovirgaria hyperparasitica]
MSWLNSLLPRALCPNFTWPHRALGDEPLVQDIPPTPKLSGSTSRRVWGIIHKRLVPFSRHYCKWFGIPFDNQICQLPFGLILKWSDGTRLEEVQAMMVARSAGLPVPRVIAYGDHPDTPHALVSILMTRLPGCDLGLVYESLTPAQQETIQKETATMLDTIRNWRSPWGKDRICSITGGPIRSVRVPDHIIGPCESETEFNDLLIQPASQHGYASAEAFEEALACARKMQTKLHRIVFTHGDLKHHNIMVHEGRVSGFIDWESAGWYPDYWDYTTAMRYMPEDFWWFKFVSQLGGSKYREEMVYERALLKLTVDSWVW